MSVECGRGRPFSELSFANIISGITWQKVQYFFLSRFLLLSFIRYEMILIHLYLFGCDFSINFQFSFSAGPWLRRQCQNVIIQHQHRTRHHFELISTVFMINCSQIPDKLEGISFFVSCHRSLDPIYRILPIPILLQLQLPLIYYYWCYGVLFCPIFTSAICKRNFIATSSAVHSKQPRCSAE